MLAALAKLLSALRAYIAYFFRPRPIDQQKTEKPASSAPGYEREASCKLDVIIVGCGLSGLVAGYCLGKAGHRVTIVEAAETLGEIGAGLQVGPNLSRLLIRWGLREKLDTLAVQPESISFRRYDNGERIGMDIYGAKIEKEYGVPHYQAHRADLHQMLCDIALPLVDLKLNSRVVSVSPDPPTPYVILQSGEVVYGDVIIGGDGVKSVVRTCLVDGPDSPTPTGDAAFRATISTEGFENDPDLKELLDHPECTIWMGPNQHAVGYNLRGNKIFNLVMLHPDTESTESWSAPGDVSEMYKLYEGWDPRLRKMQAKVTSVLKSRLMVRQPLKTWVHSSGRAALMGDACHPMLPYRGQGAAMAIEDAAVLGNLLSRITEKSQIPAILKAYESLRYDRATAAQLTSHSLRYVFHHPDGTEQQARDAAMRQAMELTLKEARGEEIPREAYGNNPNAWIDKAKKDMILNYDADQAVEDWWKEHGASIIP
ncbi:hypothetical protein M378DRAFT_179064 [Amanita muscaria Koide BX008]|uniref:FAD-binding domain-containing protein n=1 Tax=Amanita muscaria (strain Koide BX008) TaxID=946122 RepID=A0A0C2SL40_AMAMK|nr:hypothetical protein M378DRAFT_179064 [Amanita muscaria Koide BX008]